MEETSANPPPGGATPQQALITAAEVGRGTILEKLGIEWVEIGQNRLVARMPVAGNTQPYGMLHGGATATLCETVASFGAGLLAGLDRMVVGIALSVNHLRAVRDGYVTATGVALHTGRTTAVWDVKVHDDEERLVAVSRLTLSVRDRTERPGG